jgi:trans-aconitate 2-methyltransferase
MNTGPREWDAQIYDRVSDPQYGWGVEVLERLALAGDECVMDAGCGSGRVTGKLLERLPNGRVIGVDGSNDMIDLAAARFSGEDRVTLIHSDLLEMTPELLEGHDCPAQVDVVLSTATFHWIPDHEQLFRQIHRVLRPGGRLHAQCGGVGNVARHAAAIVTVASRPEYRDHFDGMSVMWNFASPEETETRLRAAGFDEVTTSLEEKPVRPDDPRAFTRASTLGPHLARLPDELREGFIDRILEASGTPLVLDYVRLNIDARRPA